MFYKKIDLLKIYFLVFSIGLIKVAEYITVKLTSRINLQSFKNTLCDWAAYFTGFKVYELSLFVISLILFSLFYFFLYWLGLKKQNLLKQNFSNKLLLVVIISVIFNIYAFKYFLVSFKTVVFILVIFSLGISCFFRELSFQKITFLKSEDCPQQFYFLICCALIIHVCSYTLPLIMRPMFIENDYMDIPEKTILSNKKVVDNTAYINKHFHQDIVKYDPRVDGGRDPVLNEIANIELDSSESLQYFFDKNFRRKYFYQYDEKLRQLKIFHHDVYEDEKNDLEILFYRIKDKITQFSLRSHIKIKKLEKLKFSEEELEFLKNNQLELLNQAKAGWFLFHHSWVVNPLHAIALGASLSNQVLIYGFASSIWLKKVLDMMGGVNYQNYFKATFILYPIYFISFLIGIWFIFRSFRVVALGGLALGICYLSITYQLLVLAPGFNPLRHFWDIWGFVLLNEYLKKEKNFYIIGAILLGLFSVVWSKDFGMALYLGIVVSFFIKQYSKQQPYAVLLAIGLVLLGAVVYFLPIYGKNYNMLYMLMGVTVPSASILLIYFVLFLISLGYILVFTSLKEKNNPFILMLGVFIYLQIILIYYIWNPNIHHLISNATGLILFGLILLDLNYEVFDKNILSKLSILILTGTYLFISTIFYMKKTQVLNPFKHHLIYQWNFKNAKFKSTMDPELFQESAKLIQKYSHANGIYLISKYDAILPVVSNKYNKIPAVSVALDMIGEKDINRMLAPILKNKPKYIYVDTDILRNYINDIYNQYGKLGLTRYNESIGRVTLMDNMKQLFCRISGQYDLVEKGRLISVYKFKNQNNE